MRTFSLVLGSIVVYFFVACASAVSTERASQPTLDASMVESSAPESSTSESTTESGVGPKEAGSVSSVVDAIADAVTDPVSKAAADPNMSGTRLKTQRYVGTDGSSSFLGMYDSQLSVACSFQKAADGTARCLPALTTAAAPSYYFSDAGCSQRIASASLNCAPPLYAYWLDYPASCATSAVVHIFSVAGAYTGQVYAGTPASCNAYPGGATNYASYSLGNEIAPSQFLQAAVQTDP
jgi:hypothetical protein